MNSKKSLVIGAIILLAAAVITAYALRGDGGVDNDGSTPTPSASPAASMSSSPTPKPTAHTVRFTTSGVSPATLTIRAGDSVTFVNNSPSALFWPASDPHPTHTLCPGFDAKRPLAQGDTYSLVFTEVRTCTYHNHLDPYNTAAQGTIIVQ